MHSATYPLDSLEKSGIKFIRIQWNDLINLIRFRVVPLKFFRKMVKNAENEGRPPYIAISEGSFGIVGTCLAKEFLTSVEWAYVADMRSLRICGYAPGYASVMG